MSVVYTQLSKNSFNQIVTLDSQDWENNTITVDLPGMTSDAVVIVGAATLDSDQNTRANIQRYLDANILAISQDTNTLTFSKLASYTPDEDIFAEVVFWR